MIRSRYLSGIILFLIFLISFVLHFRIFTTDIVGPHSWRQTATQSNIDCFFEEDNNILHPRVLARGSGVGIKQSEFPIMQWTIAQTYHVLGQSITSTRTICFVIGLLTLFGFFLLLKNLMVNPNSVLAGTAMFTFSPLFYYYMINPLPDLFALCGAVWAIHFYFRADKQNIKWMYFAGTFCLCLATLSKLPYLLFAGVPLGILINQIRSKRFRNSGIALLLSGFFLLPAIWWYVKVLPTMMWNPVIAGVFSDTKEGRPIIESIIGNLISSLPELYLNYAMVPFFLIGLFLLVRNRKKIMNQYLPFSITGIILLIYFFYEINLISTVHDYYMLPFLPLLFLLSVYGWQHIMEMRQKSIRFFAVALILATPITAFLRIDSRWNTNEPGFPADWYAYRDELRIAVPDDKLVIMGSDMTQCIMPYYLHKRGWTYYEYELTREKLQHYMNEGAKFLYTDCEQTLRDSTLRPFLKEIQVNGSVHVFELHQ